MSLIYIVIMLRTNPLVIFLSSKQNNLQGKDWTLGLIIYYNPAWRDIIKIVSQYFYIKLRWDSFYLCENPLFTLEFCIYIFCIYFCVKVFFYLCDYFLITKFLRFIESESLNRSRNDRPKIETYKRSSSYEKQSNQG